MILSQLLIDGKANVNANESNWYVNKVIKCKHRIFQANETKNREKKENETILP